MREKDFTMLCDRVLHVKETVDNEEILYFVRVFLAIGHSTVARSRRDIRT